MYRAYTKIRAGSSSLWVNIIHMILVAPVLLWIGYYGKETSRAAFELVLLLGFSALGYHIYSLMLQFNTVSGDK